MEKAGLNGMVVDLTKMTREEISGLRGKRGFVCLTCEKPVVFKNGTRKRAHFSHEFEGTHMGSPESSAHLLVKYSFAKWLKKQGIVGVVEKRFSDTHRIADVYFEYNQKKFALEVQKSPMSDGEFLARMADYEKIGVTVIWVYLGGLKKQQVTYQLPPVMIGRPLKKMFHFCEKTAIFTVFEQVTFVSNRDIYATVKKGVLAKIRVDELIKPSVKGGKFCEDWLVVKRQFRNRGWFYVSKSEKKLLEQCLMRGFNLSMIPTVVGWPVVGVGMRKPLFVWQSYVLLTLMKHMMIKEVFTYERLAGLLMDGYDLTLSVEGHRQIKGYLNWLVTFGVLRPRGRHYELLTLPEVTASMERNIENDIKYVDIVAKLLKR